MNLPTPTESDGERPKTLRGIPAIAAYCGPGISHHTVRAAARAGTLPKLAGTGRDTVVLTDDVDEWLLSLRRSRNSGSGSAA